jgi:hypothetical protein
VSPTHGEAPATNGSPANESTATQAVRSAFTVPRREILNLTPPRGARAWGEDERMDTAAVHEAGHAVARLAGALPFRYVTIRPRVGLPGEGYLAVRPRLLTHYGDVLACNIAIAAGPEAERRWYMESHGSDEEEAAWLLGFLGGGSHDDEALAHLDASMRQHLRERVALPVSDYWPAILALADRMLTDPATLAYDEARRIVGELACWPEHLR